MRTYFFAFELRERGDWQNILKKSMPKNVSMSEARDMMTGKRLEPGSLFQQKDGLSSSGTVAEASVVAAGPPSASAPSKEEAKEESSNVSGWFSSDQDFESCADAPEVSRAEVVPPSKPASVFKAFNGVRIFCDLDGVLADFQGGLQVNGISGFGDDRAAMWREIRAVPSFFVNLDMMEGAERLWAFISPYKPSILTGAGSPSFSPQEEGISSFANQKAAWCRRRLSMVDAVHVDLLHDEDDPRVKCGDENLIITTKTSRKHDLSGEGKILIDDSLKLEKAWVGEGGIFVHHKSADETIEKLKSLGFKVSSDAAAAVAPSSQGPSARQQERRLEKSEEAAASAKSVRKSRAYLRLKLSVLSFSFSYFKRVSGRRRCPFLTLCSACLQHQRVRTIF